MCRVFHLLTEPVPCLYVFIRKSKRWPTLQCGPDPRASLFCRLTATNVYGEENSPRNIGKYTAIFTVWANQRTDADFAAFCQRETDVADTLESAVEVDAVAVSAHTRRVALIVV